MEHDSDNRIGDLINQMLSTFSTTIVEGTILTLDSTEDFTAVEGERVGS